MSVRTKIYKVSLLLLLALTGMLSVLYFQFEAIAKHALIRMLEKESFQVTAFSSSSPSIRGVSFEYVVLEKPNSLEISIENLTIGYSIENLISKQIDEISVEALKITQKNSASKNSDTSPAFIQSLKSFLASIPSKNIKIQRIILDSGESSTQAENLRITSKVNLTEHFATEVSVKELILGSTTIKECFLKLAKEKHSETLSIESSIGSIEHDVQTLKGITIKGSLEPKGNVEHGTLELKVASPTLAGTIQGTHNIEAQLIELTYSTLPIALVELQSILQSKLLIENGQISFNGQTVLKKQAHTSTSLKINIRNLAGRVNNIAIDKLSTEFTLALPSLTSQKSIHMKAERVFAVTELKNVVAELDLKKSKTSLPFVYVKKLESSLLGGQISTDPFTFNLSQILDKPFTVNINFKSVLVDKLFELHPQQAVSGTGTIEGSIPVTISKDGLEIQQAKINASTPGIIKLSEDVSKNLAQGNSSLGPIYQALEDFHYTSMRSGATLEKNGDLLLSVSLEGRNPNSSEKRPFAFNINISENIPALLKSINLAQSVNKQIQQSLSGNPKKSSKPSF